MDFTLDGLGSNLEQFYREWQEDLFQLYSGVTATSRLGSIYQSRAGIFSAETVEQLHAMRGGALSIEERRRVDHLLKLVMGGYLERVGKPWLERLLAAETEAEVELDGKLVPYRHLLFLLGQDRDRAGREKLHRASLPVKKRLDALRKEQLTAMEEGARRVGYHSLANLFRQLAGIDVSGILEAAEGAVRRLDPLFRPAMNRISLLLLERPFQELAEHDLPYLGKGELFDGYFPEERLLEGFWLLAAGMGMSLADRKNLVLDLEPRDGKGELAMLFPVRVPQQLVLSVTRTGGYQAYQRLYQEGGRALYLAHVRESLPFEFRVSGDGALGEGYAFLLDSLLGSPRWWGAFMGGEIPPFLREYRAAMKLFTLRDALGSALADDYLLGNWGSGEAAVEYARIREGWRGVPYDAAQAHYHCDLFRALWRIRALMFEAQLRAALVERFGRSWFGSPDAAGWLRKLWGEGTRRNAEELLGGLGIGGLDPLCLAREIEEELRRFG